MCVHVCLCVCVCVYVFVCVCACVFACLLACLLVCLFVWLAPVVREICLAPLGMRRYFTADEIHGLFEWADPAQGETRQLLRQMHGIEDAWL